MKKLFILIITFFSTFLVSCEKDEIIVETFQNKNPKVKEISLNQLSNDKKFVTAFSKISKNHQINNAVSRTVMENQYNFTIDDYPAKVIELDSLTSYTFSINNETRTSSVFENLVVNHYTNGTTKAAIFKYFPNQNNTLNDSISVEHNSKYFEGRTEITPIIYNANNSSLRQTMVCITSNVLLCNYGGRTHPAGEKCGSTFWGTQTNCETIFTAPEFCTSIVQVIEDTGNNNGGATSVSVGMALADNFANTQLTPLQKLIYDSNPSIREYLANNVLIVPVPNYNPLLGGDSTMAVIDPNAIDFADELIDLAVNETEQEDVHNLVNLSILIEDCSDEEFFTDEFAQKLVQYTDISLTTLPPNYPISLLSIKTLLNYKKLRQLNPEWSKSKCLWEATKEIVHLSLDAFGLIPVGGEVADLINGVLYTIEGDKLNATLSYASAIPVAGWSTASVKFAIKIKDVSQTAYTVSTKVKLVWKNVDGVIKFGDRGQLRKVLGMGTSAVDARQAHHIIPWAKQSHPAVQKAAKSSNAFHMNEALNGIPLNNAVHNGSHANYDNLVQIRLNAIPANATPNQAYEEILDIINDIKNAIQNNPGVPINQLNF